MEIVETRQGDVLIVAPVGRLDTTTSRDLETRFLELLGEGNLHYIVDFGQIEYVSSAGLRVLLMLGKRLPGLQGSLVLCTLSAPVMEVFEVAGFSRIFTIVPGPDKALSEIEKIRTSSDSAGTSSRRSRRQRSRSGRIPRPPKADETEAKKAAPAEPAPEPTTPAAESPPEESEPRSPSVEELAIELLRQTEAPPFLKEEESKKD